MMIRFFFAGCLLIAVAPLGKTSQAEEKGKRPTGRFGAAVDITRTPLRTNTLKDYSQLPLTVECWIKLPDEKMARYHVLLSHAPGNSARHWELYTTPLQGMLTAKVDFLRPVQLRTFIRVADAQWHHLAMTISKREIRLLVNGRLAARQAVKLVRGDDSGRGELFVGGDSDGRRDGANHQVLVDELRISHVIRPPGRPSKPFANDADTVGLWHFNEQAGNRYSDASQRTNALAYSPNISAEWTPRSSQRPNAADWERETDADWLDERFNQMDVGGFLGSSMEARIPFSKRATYAGKGLAIRIGGTKPAAVLFDRGNLQLRAGWTGGFVTIPAARFGLIRHPQVLGKVVFGCDARAGWQQPADLDVPDTSRFAPLPDKWGRFDGLYRHGRRTVLSYQVGGTRILDSPSIHRRLGQELIVRSLDVAKTQHSLTLQLMTLEGAKVANQNELWWARAERGEESIAVAARGGEQSRLSVEGAQVRLHLAPQPTSSQATVYYWRGPSSEFNEFLTSARMAPGATRLAALTKGGPRQWTEKIVTKRHTAPGQQGAFLVDTLTLPYDNPYKSILSVTGVGFLPDDRIVVSTIYGDVWTVKEEGDQLHWQRFAAGLYQPLGLVVMNGKVLVLERGQITRLHDLNDDGEADYYENYYNGWETPGAGHAYDTCLKAAPDGSLFFFKGQVGGQPARESGCLIRVLPLGTGHEIYATGFRHPIGLGMRPDGVVTGADQQGNWMPATRIDRYRRGGFYGDMRTHHREQPPTAYDPPICWLPQYVDNSAAGQVWIPEKHWGPFEKQWLHCAWGRCWLYLLLHDEVQGQIQGGVVRLPCDQLLAGPMTAVFRPTDGHLYLVGLHGWQTAAVKDGCLQRVRYSGESVCLPIGLRAYEEGIELQLSAAIDQEAAQALGRYSAERWNYRYSENYGSDHWSLKNPQRMGHDSVKVKLVRVAPDGKRMFLEIEDMRAVMQMKLRCRFKMPTGKEVSREIHHTIHRLRPGRPPW